MLKRRLLNFKKQMYIFGPLVSILNVASCGCGRDERPFLSVLSFPAGRWWLLVATKCCGLKHLPKAVCWSSVLEGRLREGSCCLPKGGDLLCNVTATQSFLNIVNGTNCNPGF